MSYQELINQKGIYLAGGWFTPTQMERLEWVRDNLRALGFKLFSPKDDALCPSDANLDFRTKIFKGGVEEIKKASCVFAITNEKDMGTLFECGLAYAYDKPIVYFAEDLNGPFNLMLSGSAVHVITSREQLVKDMSNEQILKRIYENDPISYEGNVE